jgi:hypothetical protein
VGPVVPDQQEPLDVVLRAVHGRDGGLPVRARLLALRRARSCGLGAPGLLLKTLILVKVAGPAGTSLSLHAYVHRTVFGSWLSPCPASLAHALAHVVGWGAVLWAMDRRHVYVTV